MKDICLLILSFAISVQLSASCEYDWDGSSSSSWNTNANWSSTPGSLSPGSQIYNIGAPGTYTNAPNINASNTINVDYIDMFAGGQLTISSGTSDADNDIAVRGGADITASGGTFTVSGNLYLYDDGSSITVSGCSLIVTGTLYLGLQHPNRDDGTNGSPSLTVSSGYLSCSNLVFDDAEGDTPSMTISGGEVEVSGDVRSDGAAVNITISGSGVLDIGDDLNMDGGSDVLTMTGGTLQIADDWDNSGSTSLSGGTIEFDGSGGQTVDINTSITFNNVTLNNSGTSGVTLNDPANVNGAFTFTDGVLNTTSTNYVNFADGATASGASSASYVDGPVRKTGNDAFVFPIGDGGNYQPLTISAPSVISDYFEAQYFFSNPSSVYGWGSGVFGTGVVKVSTREYWDLSRSGTSNISLTMPWNSNSGGVVDINDILLVHWTGSEWENLTGSVSGNASAGTITVATVTSFSPFTLGSSSFDNPLPVELLEFSGNSVAEGVLLNWKTVSELNNSHFELERKIENGDFELLSSIPSKAPLGLSNEELSYAYLDETATGQVYYRLRQVDRNGEFEYSNTIFVDLNDQNANEFQLELYPNPVVDHFFLKSDLASGEYQVSLVSASGQQMLEEVWKLEAGDFEYQFPESIGSGVYFLNIENEQQNTRETKRIIVR